MIVANPLNTLNFFKISKFFVYMALFSVVLVSTETLFPFIVTKYVFFRASVGLAFISFLLGWLFLGEKESKDFEREALGRLKSPLFIAVSLFVLIFIIAGVFGFIFCGFGKKLIQDLADLGAGEKFHEAHDVVAGDF